MAREHWDPFRELRRMEETMDRLWSTVGRQAGATPPGADAWAIPLDIVQHGDTVVVHAALPGVRPADVSVTVEDGVLTIRGETREEHPEKDASYLLRERRAGTFVRSIHLPDSVDAEMARSSCADGVLTVTFPRNQAKRVKQVRVEVRDSTGEAGKK